MDKTLAEYQEGMPPEVKAEHDAMTKAAAETAAKDLEREAMKCHYFGNECPTRGPDGLMQASENFARRARYFRLLAASKGATVGGGADRG